jgi:hypothetical protein
MSSTIRSDSYSESVQRGLHPLTITSIVPQRRSATTENVNRRSMNYPEMSGSFPSTRSATISASTALFFYSLYP